MRDARVLVLGLTFKENCPDLRNTQGGRRRARAAEYGAKVDVYDPWVDADEAEHEYGFAPSRSRSRQLRRGRSSAWRTTSSASWASTRCARSASKTHVLYDIKYVFPTSAVDGRL